MFCRTLFTTVLVCLDHYSSLVVLLTLRERMTVIWPVVREHVAQAQHAQECVFNWGAQPGEKVLVLIPRTKSNFLAKWHGPYNIVELESNVNDPPTGVEKTPPALSCELTYQHFATLALKLLDTTHPGLL